jgi:hypothetical protein
MNYKKYYLTILVICLLFIASYNLSNNYKKVEKEVIENKIPKNSRLVNNFNYENLVLYKNMLNSIFRIALNDKTIDYKIGIDTLSDFTIQGLKKIYRYDFELSHKIQTIESKIKLYRLNFETSLVELNDLYEEFYNNDKCNIEIFEAINEIIQLSNNKFAVIIYGQFFYLEKN